MSKIFITAYLNFHDNELIQKMTSANSQVEAMKLRLQEEGLLLTELELDDVEQVKGFAFDVDCAIDAIEIAELWD